MALRAFFVLSFVTLATFVKSQNLCLPPGILPSFLNPIQICLRTVSGELYCPTNDCNFFTMCNWMTIFLDPPPGSLSISSQNPQPVGVRSQSGRGLGLVWTHSHNCCGNGYFAKHIAWPKELSGKAVTNMTSLRASMFSDSFIFVARFFFAA